MNPNGPEETASAVAAGKATFAFTQIPDHELMHRIASGSYGEVWLARSTLGSYRAIKIVYRKSFAHERPFEREFTGIQKFEPVSRSHEGVVDILQVGRNNEAGYFYYVMELADDASKQRNAGVMESWSNEQRSGAPTLHHSSTPPLQDGRSYTPRTLSHELSTRGRLPFEECLSIGLALSSALAHLHKNGLIHRDVKPSNIIFVNGAPKLADIGLVADVAEALSYVGTEGFIPPEGPGTAQADLYSLGKVLYEISTGKDRHDYPELPTKLDETSHQTDLLELNEIVLKACRADTRKRYQTAEQMHADLLLLQRGRSIKQIRKLERRLAFATKVGIVAGSIALLAVGAFFGSIKQIQRARRAEQRAEQVANFLKEMLTGVAPSVALGRDTKLLQEILDQTAERVGRELNEQPEVEADLRTTLGQVYEALGNYEQAEKMQRAALALRESIFGAEHPQVALSLNGLAMALRQQGKLEEAEKLQRQALAMQKLLLPKAHLDLARSLNDLATILLDGRTKLAEAELLELEALNMMRKLLTEDDHQVALVLSNLAAILGALGKSEEAVAKQEEALGLQRILLEKEHPDIAQSLNNLSVWLRDAGNFAEAEAAARDALELRKKILGPKHAYVATSLNNLASALWKQMKLDEAESSQRQALAIQTEALGSTHPETLIWRNNLGTILHDQGQFAEAEETHQQVLAIRTNVFDLESAPVAESLNNLARVLCDQGRFAEAVHLQQQSLEIHLKLLPGDHWALPLFLNNLGVALCGDGRLTEAEAKHIQALALRRQIFSEDHPHIAQSLNSLGLFYREQNRLAEAETNLLQALGICRKLPGQHELLLAATLENLTLLRRDQARFQEAEQLAQECLAIREKRLTNNWRTFSAQALLGSALLAQEKYAEAEPLLLSGCQGMKNCQERIPAPNKRRFKEALEYVIQLYENTERPAQAAVWRQDLLRF